MKLSDQGIDGFLLESRFLDVHPGKLHSMRSMSRSKKVLTSLLKKRIQEMPIRMEKHPDRFVELYNVLDQHQQAQLIEMIRERFGRWEN